MIEGRRRLVAEFAFEFRDELDGQLQLLLSRLQLGQTLTYTDRNGTVHAFTYDVLGRITPDVSRLADPSPNQPPALLHPVWS